MKGGFSTKSEAECLVYQIFDGCVFFKADLTPTVSVKKNIDKLNIQVAQTPTVKIQHPI